MEFRVLGPLEVWSRGRRIRVGGARAEKLLAALALESGHTVPVERLVDVLWDDDPPATAPRQVQNTAGAVRRILAAQPGQTDVLVTDGPGYRLGPDNVRLDTQVVVERLALARDAVTAGDPAKAVEEMRAALALFRGPTLAGIGSRVLASAVLEWDERRLSTLEECVELELRLGRHRDLVGELAALIAEHPLRERFTAQLMLALYRGGRVGDALDVYRRLRTRLSDELGLDVSPELHRLESAILRADPTLQLANDSVSTPGWRGPRPALTVVIGRDRERAEVAALARQSRLITLGGVGGVGKSSLALAVATDLAADFDGEVAVVALAGVRGAEEVVLAIGSVLQITGSSTAEVAQEIGRYLAPRKLLLVLDNCEHVAAGCAQTVQQLLAGSPALAVLATSRRPLGLAEEVVYGLDGLDGTASAELFGRRAWQARPGIVLDAAQVARICARLDGLPLAIELAAARLRALPMRELADRLDEDFGLLSVGHGGADPRHVTLAAAIEWSYLLLDQDEQRLLARLSVFRAGFTAREAEEVCADPPLSRALVLPTLAGLVDHSVVAPYHEGEAARYRLLETVREFAAAHLARLGESDAVADRHLDYRLAQFRRVDNAPTLPEVALAGIAIWPEPANLRAALQHGFTAGRPIEAMELIGLVYLHWMVRRIHHTEGDRWLSEGWPYLDRCPAELRRRSLLGKAIIDLDRGDPLSTRSLLRPIADDAGDDVDLRIQCEALSMLTVSELRTLNPAALRTGATFLARYRDFTDPDQVLLAMHSLTYALVTWGRYEQAGRLCAEYADLAEVAGPSYAGRYFAIRSQVEHGRGNHEVAATFAAHGQEQYARPGSYAHQSLLHRALVHGALCVGDAREVAAHSLNTLCAMYPPSMARAAEFTVLLGEAHRRAGEHDTALPLLADGLTGGAQDYAAMLPGVLSTALLAANLGDHDASHDLSHGWDTVRRGLGLPVPQGFEAAVESVLGLDPAGGIPTIEWAEDPLRALVTRAADWCAARST